MKKSVFAAIFCLYATVAAAQNVKNPSQVTFDSPDHTAPGMTNYEADIVRSDSTVVQTISIPVASVTTLPAGSADCINAAGCYRATLNVQPTAFGTGYRIVIRAVAGAAKADNSAPSNAFDRVPGNSGNVKVK